MDKHRDVGRYPYLSVKITAANQPKLAAVFNNSENHVIEKRKYCLNPESLILTYIFHE
jgi:hypothetical protein